MAIRVILRARKEFLPASIQCCFEVTRSGAWQLWSFRPKVLDSNIESMLSGRLCFIADFKAREGSARSHIQRLGIRQRREGRDAVEVFGPAIALTKTWLWNGGRMTTTRTSRNTCGGGSTSVGSLLACAGRSRLYTSPARESRTTRASSRILGGSAQMRMRGPAWWQLGSGCASDRAGIYFEFGAALYPGRGGWVGRWVGGWGAGGCGELGDSLLA